MSLNIKASVSSGIVADIQKGTFFTIQAGSTGRQLVLMGEFQNQRAAIFLGAVGLSPEQSKPSFDRADAYSDELAVCFDDVYVEIQPGPDGFPKVANAASNGSIHIGQSGDAWIYIREHGRSSYFNLKTGNPAQSSPGTGWFEDWCLVQRTDNGSVERVLYKNNTRMEPPSASVSPLKI